MPIINFTSKDIVLYTWDGQPCLYPAQAQPGSDGHAPEPLDDTIYIVDEDVLRVHPERHDLFVVADAMYHKRTGLLSGYARLSRYPEHKTDYRSSCTATP